VNNVSVSTPSEDIMAPLLRLCDQSEVSKMNKLTACYIDQNYNYINNLHENFQCSNNPVSSITSVGYDSTIQPNGTLKPTIVVTQTDTAGAVVTNNISQSVLVCIAVNSGIMVTQQGSSSLYSGLLTKNMVLEAKQQQPSMDSATFSSLTGGSIQEKCGSNLRKLLKKQYGSKGAGMSAGGMSAGGLSAGGLSAGSVFGDKVGKYADTVSKMSKYI